MTGGFRSFKASETLLGIETFSIFSDDRRQGRFKASETLLGIETCYLHPA